ncbi:hypothetical protein AtubIFM55763_002050 [Aspergillus tubingensis]|nr:hypothetical protein AtubIFM55763_002050 [Aspergillus tubingensis]
MSLFIPAKVSPERPWERTTAVPQPFWPKCHIPDGFQRETKNFQVTVLRNSTGHAVKLSQSPASSKKAIEAPDGEHFIETIIGYLRSCPDDPSTKKSVVHRDGKAACDMIQGLLQRQHNEF